MRAVVLTAVLAMSAHAAPVPPEKPAGNPLAGTWVADPKPKGLTKAVVKEAKDGWTIQVWSAGTPGKLLAEHEWPAAPLRMITESGAKSATRGLATWDDGDCTVTATFRVAEGKLRMERYTVWKTLGAGKDVLFEDTLTPSK